MATHFLGPVLNREKADHPRGVFSNLPVGMGPEVVSLYNDFVRATDYSTSDFTLTAVGSGTAAVATTTGQVNGYLVLTTTNTSGDSNSLQGKQNSFQLTVGKRLWLEVGAKAATVTDIDALIALAVADTTPLDASDYVGFLVANGSGAVAAKTVASSTATTLSAVGTLVAATDMKLGLVWDGISKVSFYINRSLVGSSTTNIPTATPLAITAHVKTNSANARTLSIDYVFAAQER